MCHKKMKYVSRKQMSLNYIFLIPEFVVGFPLFNVGACMDFIKTSLVRDGFCVRMMTRNALYVSWDWEEINAFKAMQPLTGKAAAEKSRINMIDFKPSGKLLMNLN